MAYEKRQKAIDLQHHISDFSRARVASPLKGLQKYYKPGSYMLAGGQYHCQNVDVLPRSFTISWTGLPSPAYFPFSSIAGEALIPESFALTAPEPSSFSWLWNIFKPSSSAKEKTSTVTIPKYPAKPGDLCLSTTLQYSPAVAFPQLQEIMYEFTTKVYQPAYEDYTTLVHTGNTDGLVHSNIPSQNNAILMEKF
jgi:aromatic amino acid aminotransferase I